jgi:cytochrome c-type biogenesis protein CcmH/NrfG
MPESAQDKKTKLSISFTSMQAYSLAIITLSIGLAVGYFARVSTPSAVSSVAAQTAPATAPPGMAGRAVMGNAQLPGIGTQQQTGMSHEMMAEAAKPLLAKLQTNPKDFETLRQLGNLYYDGHAFSQAVEYYNKALAIDPKNPDVLTDLGTSYWYSGDPDKALSDFDKSLAIRPNHSGTLFNVGIVKWQGKKDPQGAIVVWEQLLKTNPNYEQKEQVQMLIERAKVHGAGAT